MTFHSPLLRAFTPKQLFWAGEKGVWYDPSDMSTLWQDSARTTAVTAVEQPVGCIDDKSGNGVNATQSTSASRPVLSARYNLLERTQDFSNAVWALTGSASPSTAAPTKGTTTGTRPDNTSGTIDTVTFPAVSSGAWSFIGQSPSLRIFDQTTFSVYARISSGTATIYLSVQSTGAGPSSGNFYTASGFTLTTSWQKISISGTQTTIGGDTSCVIGFDTRADAGQTNSSSLTVQLWGADFRVNRDTSDLPSYQRVTTSTDYDAVGFRPYLRFDGTDDFLLTSSIDFTGTNKITSFSAFRKRLNAFSAIVELSPSVDTNNGSFLIYTGGTATAGVDRKAIEIALRGTQTTLAYFTPVNDGLYSAIVTAEFDISQSARASELVRLRLNGANGTVTYGGAADAGTGNFGNYALFIGRRNNASGPFNGHFYGCIVRAAASSIADVTDTESWLNSRIRAY